MCALFLHFFQNVYFQPVLTLLNFDIDGLFGFFGAFLLTFLLFDDIYSVYLSSFTLLIGGLKPSEASSVFTTGILFYLTHWRFETWQQPTHRSVIIATFYLTHWRFETVILNWICELTVVSFYLTHWRFETCFISAFSVIWILFYLTHWWFETIGREDLYILTIYVLPYSLEV